MGWRRSLGLALVGLAVVAGLWVALTLHTPGPPTVPGEAVRADILAQLVRLGVIAQGERVLYLYSPDYPDVSANVKVVTDRRLIVRANGQLQSAPYPDITHLWYADTDAECRKPEARFAPRCFLGATSSLAVERQDGSRFLMMLSDSEQSTPFALAAEAQWKEAR